MVNINQDLTFHLHQLENPNQSYISIYWVSSHKEITKKTIIKGYADRARALCDEQHLESEMNNIAEVFRENGYKEKEIKEAMK